MHLSCQGKWLSLSTSCLSADGLLGSAEAWCSAACLMRASLRQNISQFLPPNPPLANSSQRFLVEQGEAPGLWIYKAWSLPAFWEFKLERNMWEMYQRIHVQDVQGWAPSRGPELWIHGNSKGMPSLRSGDVLALEGFHCVSLGEAVPFGSR